MNLGGESYEALPFEYKLKGEVGQNIRYNNTMPGKVIRFISILLSFSLILQQSGFAQIMPSQQAATFSQPPLLRYLSVNSANPFNYFNFLLDKGDSRAGLNLPYTVDNLTAEAKKLINYFFLGITLQSESFWVNLRPDEPGRITSDELSKTDLGRALLEQDLQLKRDVAKYIHPAHPKGKEFWEKLYAAIGKGKVKKLEITTSNRVWIVPDEAVVLETEDGAFVASAKLKVMLENDYLKAQKGLSPQTVTGHFPSGLKQSNSMESVPFSIQVTSERLMREIVLPPLTDDINNSSIYAPLRQIYQSLILAEWFKRKHKTSNSVYSFCINKGYTKGLESELPWLKQAIWQEYLKSYRNGEYKLEDTLFGLRRTYWSGGMSFASLSFNTSSAITVAGSSSLNAPNEDILKIINISDIPQESSNGSTALAQQKILGYAISTITKIPKALGNTIPIVTSGTPVIDEEPLSNVTTSLILPEATIEEAPSSTGLSAVVDQPKSGASSNKQIAASPVVSDILRLGGKKIKDTAGNIYRIRVALKDSETNLFLIEAIPANTKTKSYPYIELYALGQDREGRNIIFLQSINTKLARLGNKGIAENLLALIGTVIPERTILVFETANLSLLEHPVKTAGFTESISAEELPQDKPLINPRKLNTFAFMKPVSAGSPTLSEAEGPLGAESVYPEQASPQGQARRRVSSAIKEKQRQENRIVELVSAKLGKQSAIDAQKMAELFLPYSDLQDVALEELIEKSLQPKEKAQKNFEFIKNERKTLDSFIDSLRNRKEKEIVITSFGLGEDARELTETVRILIDQILENGELEEPLKIILQAIDINAESLLDLEKKMKMHIESLLPILKEANITVEYNGYFGDVKNYKIWKHMVSPSDVFFWRHTWVGQTFEMKDMKSFARLLWEQMNIQGAIIVSEGGILSKPSEASTLEVFAIKDKKGEPPPETIASSAIEKNADSKGEEGGIDLSQIELTLKDESYISSLNPADLKILRAAKALKDQWDGLSLLYVHEIMILMKDGIIKDIQNKELLQNVLQQLQIKSFLDPQAVQFMNLIQSQKPISEIKVSLLNQ